MSKECGDKLDYGYLSSAYLGQTYGRWGDHQRFLWRSI
ncbi:MAG: hypothetical protein OGMRLDGQ_002756 [Candidatus Fervidibacter sp.]